MVETSLVYIHRTRPTKAFVGCGVVLAGDLIATCRHVWRDATVGFAGADSGPTAEVEFPQFWQDGVHVTSGASLADPCRAEPYGPEPDLVLLQPDAIPEDALRLSPASMERFETGPGYAYAGLPGRDAANPSQVQEVTVPGVIASPLRGDRRRQFTGENQQGYWTDRGSSGSPVFLEKGEQLAGIISLSETGRKSGESSIHEAFVVPGTLIRRYVSALAKLRKMAEQESIPAARLQPILDAIGAADVPVEEYPERLHQFVEAARARGAEPIQQSNEGADIDAVIGAARDKIGLLDAAGARSVLQTKIDEEEAEARRARMLPLLKERTAIERLAFDHAAAIGTLGEITRLAPDDVWVWINLGEEWLTTGSLTDALASFRSAQVAAQRGGDQRDLSVSHEKIGDVLVAQGDLPGALTAYRTGLGIRQTLAASDTGNTQRQRDLSISHEKIGDVLVAQGDLASALTAYRTGLRIRQTLAARDAGNTQWQRDLSVSHNKIGDVLVAQGDLPGALTAYRRDLEIAETLAARDTGNTQWQRDLSVSHEKIGDVLVAQGDLPGALTAYRTGLGIRQTLTALDAGNTQWQRDLSVSHENIGNVLVAQGDLPGALTAYRTGLRIRQTLAARDAGNTQWQRDLHISLGCVADVLIQQRDLDEARPLAARALTLVRDAIVRFPDDPRVARDLPYYENLLHRAGGDPSRQ
jgi:tetratricopeptide (TPR) repeat protein